MSGGEESDAGDAQSMGMNTDIFREEELQDDDDAASQGGGGKTKEQKEAEIGSKVS